MTDHRDGGPPDDDRSVRARFEMALRVGRIGTWRWDVATGFVDWDASMEELFGFAPGTFDGTYETYAARLHPDDRPEMRASLDRALAERLPEYVTHHRVLLPDGEIRWFSSTARLILDATGEPAELIGVAVDVTEQRRSDLERDEARAREDQAHGIATAAQRRLELLARVSDLLDAPLDVDRTLQEVADLAVAELADWCIVDVFDLSGQIQHAAVAHRDPAMVARTRELQRQYPTDLTTPAMRELLDTLRPMYVPSLDDEMLAASVSDPVQLALMRELKLSSYIVVPMVVRGRAIGLLSLVSSDGRRLEHEDVALGTELARRAGASVAKAQLHGDLQVMAATMQTSLLPPSLPTIADVSLSAFYRSGTDGVDIGGDFYDVFRTGSRRWWVVLGDVCGKGPAAAAMAAAVRYTSRAIALDTDDPAELLHRLNDVMRSEDWQGRFTTMVVATFEPSGTDDLELCVVSGGHPPALVRRADGSVEEVASRGTIVGVLPSIRADAVDVTLAHGDTLVLYTDGATEALDAAGNELGEGTLREILEVTQPVDGPTASSSDLATRLAEAVIGRAQGGLRDDLAVVAVVAQPG